MRIFNIEKVLMSLIEIHREARKVSYAAPDMSVRAVFDFGEAKGILAFRETARFEELEHQFGVPSFISICTHLFEERQNKSKSKTKTKNGNKNGDKMSSKRYFYTDSGSGSGSGGGIPRPKKNANYEFLTNDCNKDLVAATIHYDAESDKWIYKRQGRSYTSVRRFAGDDWRQVQSIFDTVIRKGGTVQETIVERAESEAGNGGGGETN